MCSLFGWQDKDKAKEFSDINMRLSNPKVTWAGDKYIGKTNANTIKKVYQGTRQEELRGVSTKGGGKISREGHNPRSAIIFFLTFRRLLASG